MEFEDGPSEDLILQWATYYDAADQAGISRLYGGIHVGADDAMGRILGARVGLEAFLKANYLGGISQRNIRMTNLRTLQFLDPQGKLIASHYKYLNRNTNLPVKRLNSSDLDDSLLEDLEPGIYYAIHADESSSIETRVIGEPLHGYACDGVVESDLKTLSVVFELPDDQIATMLIRGLCVSVLNGDSRPIMEDTVLKLYRIGESGEEILIDENDDWNHHDLDSLAQVIIAREGLSEFVPAGKDSLVVAQLPKGTYKVLVEGKPGFAGLATLEITLPILDES